MGTFITLILVVGVIAGYIKWQNKAKRDAAAVQQAARVRHLRSGEYPSSCSWCKNTGLARKLILFERDDEGWRASDLFAGLARCPDKDVQNATAIFFADHPRWRRFCAEKCATDFFVTQQVATAQTFRACEYCSVRFPSSLMQCSHCGALRSQS